MVDTSTGGVRPVALRWSRVAAVAVAATVAAVVAGLEAPDAIWRDWASGHPWFSATDLPAVQLTWPTVGTTAGLAASVTHAVRLGLDTLGLSQLIGVPGVVSGATVVAVVVVARQIGCGMLAALCAALTAVFGARFWTGAATGQPETMAVPCVLGAAAGLVAWRRSNSSVALTAAAAAAAAAMAIHPASLGAMPALLVLALSGGVARAAILACGAAVGSVTFWWASRDVPLSSWLTVPSPAVVADRLGSLAGDVATDAGLLGLVLVALGTVAMARRPARLGVLVAGMAGIVSWCLLWTPPDWRGPLVLALVPFWLLVGAGMSWAQSVVTTRPATAGVAGLVVLLPAMSLTAHFDRGTRQRALTELVESRVDELSPVVPADAVVVSESVVLDRLLVDRARVRPGVALTRIPQTPDAVLEALAAGRTVVSFAGARRNLEALGFRFRSEPWAEATVGVPELIDSVPDDWIVAVAIGTQFPVSVEPDVGPTFEAIGGMDSLLGRSRWRYGVVGVRGHDHPVIEQGGYEAVDLDLDAADPLGPHVRAPVRLRVRSHDRGAEVWYRNRVVASTKTGVALAVVTPSGELAGAFDAEFRADQRVPVSSPVLALSVVTGREPCRRVTATRWTDVASVTRFASVGAVIGPGQDLTLYVGSDHAHRIRELPLGTGPGPVTTLMSVATTDGQADSMPAGLVAELREAGLGDATVALSDRHAVTRIDVSSPRTGLRQLALALGGFMPVAFARLTGPEPAAPVQLCSGMQTGASRTAGRQARRGVVDDIDLTSDGPFVFGWHRPEQAGPWTFRWTSAPRAELLVPVDRPDTMAVALELGPPLVEGTMLELRVNDTAFAPVVLTEGTAQYRWVVPAEVWRAGMNQLWLGTSRLVRPAELGPTADERVLGVAVRGIRLLADAPGPDQGSSGRAPSPDGG